MILCFVVDVCTCVILYMCLCDPHNVVFCVLCVCLCVVCVCFALVLRHAVAAANVCVFLCVCFCVSCASVLWLKTYVIVGDVFLVCCMLLRVCVLCVLCVLCACVCVCVFVRVCVLCCLCVSCCVRALFL